jgi:hypothetical protein
MSLKELRKLSGLTQFQLSQRCAKVSRMRLSLSECGQLTLHPEEQEELRAVLLEIIASRNAQLNRLLSSQEATEAVAV